MKRARFALLSRLPPLFLLGIILQGLAASADISKTNVEPAEIFPNVSWSRKTPEEAGFDPELLEKGDCPHRRSWLRGLSRGYRSRLGQNP